MHDFADKDLGKAVPYGVYDVTASTGWVNVGTDADTGQFAVESIRRWWNTVGEPAYSDRRAGARSPRTHQPAERQLNLRRWVGGREFADLHDASVVWLEQHFQVIERDAPWLQRIGSDVWDFCKGGVSSPFFRLTPGHSATAGCVRR